MATQQPMRRPVRAVELVEPRRAATAPRGSDYDWPQSPALELWAIRIQLDAACRKGEARQGWVPCRVVRRALGVPA